MSEVAPQSRTPARAQQGRSHDARRDRERPAGGLAAVGVLQGLAGNRAVNGMLGGGTPLPPAVRADMESRFGQGFGDVRIHDSPTAHANAAAWHAKAYTHGADIVFSANRFAPQTPTGKRLLAHELAHVVQQRRGGVAPALDSGASHERGADAAADAVASGQGTVSVAGATGVGVARDEDEGWGAALRRKYRDIKEKIPPAYREKVQQAADFAADKTVDAVALPFGPAAAYAADGLGSALLHGAQKTVSGQEGAADDLKNFGRDKVQEGLGTAKGVATQVTEVVDTAMWVGNEYKGMRDKAAEAIGGKEGSVGNTIVRRAIDATAQTVPGMQALPSLADASDAARSVGLVDPETKQASITAPMSGKLNEWARAAEEKLGAKPRDPEMFTPMEKAEIASSLGVQVALSATGAEEVKVAMNVVGALSGVRAIVETIRNDRNWKTSPRFWGHIIGLGLSIVGLKHSMAASKITTLVLKYGGVVAAAPVLAQMAADYYRLETNPQMPEDERKQLEASIKQDWVAAIHIVKDAILHVAQSQGGKPKGAATDESTTGTAANKGTASADDSVGGTNAGKGTAANEEGSGTKAPATVAPVEDAAAKQPAIPRQVTETAVNPDVAGSATAKPVVSADATKPPVDTAARGDGSIPLASGKGKPQSAASKSLEATLARQRPGQAGSVTRLPTRKAGGTPPTEPASQPVPEVLDVPEQVAVGQTHGPGGATTGKPKLSVIQGGDEPAMAALKPPPGSASTQGPGNGVTPLPQQSGSAKASVGKPRGGTSASAGELEPPAASTNVAKPPPSKAAATPDPLEARLNALDVPPDKRAAFKKAVAAVRKAAARDPAAADRLLEGLEERFAPGARSGPGGKSAQVGQDFGDAQSKLYPEQGADGKYRQSVAGDERALQEQAKPGGKAVLKARVRESERLGVAGGEQQAGKEGITVQDWDTPQKWKGEFGKGPDALGARGDKRQILEFKGGRSSLGKSKGVVEMSNEWVGRKIAELEAVGDRATAADLLKAARDGNLQGVVYRTRDLKAGETTTRLKGHQLRDHLRNENISPGGLIEYSPTKVEKAYQQRLKELKKAIASGNLRGLKNL